jgi:hypothetical protein
MRDVHLVNQSSRGGMLSAGEAHDEKCENNCDEMSNTGSYMDPRRNKICPNPVPLLAGKITSL